MNPKNTVFDAKRLLGRKFADKHVQHDMQRYPFLVVDNDGKPAVEVRSQRKTTCPTPEDISAHVLCNLRETAEMYLGREVDSAVITVPANFNNSQRQATKNAATIAGLKVLRLINEPTAAAIAYGLTNGHWAEEHGAEKNGTDEHETDEDGVEERGTEDRTDEHGTDKHGTKNSKKTVLVFDFGGGTFDTTLMTIQGSVIRVLSTTGDSHLGGQDIDDALFEYLTTKYSLSGHAKSRLRTECENMKRMLSSVEEVPVDVGDVYESCTRRDLEQACRDPLKRPMRLIRQLFSGAKEKVEEADVDEIVLVGGSTRIPYIRNALSDRFGDKLNHTVNPDEAVAIGAAIQAETIAAQKRTLLLLDVTPISLGIMDNKGKMAVVIPRNTRIPTEEEEEFLTVDPLGVDIDVYEGENRLATKNNLLGNFSIATDAPRGTSVLVRFTVDVNGIINASAEVLGQSKSIAIQSKNLLSGAEIQRKAEEFRDGNQRSPDVSGDPPAEIADDKSHISLSSVSDSEDGIPGSRKS